MEQIDALRAMLAETADYWDDMRIDIKYGLWADGKDAYTKVIRPAETATRSLIAAMHNAMPALLDVAEMVEAIEKEAQSHMGISVYDGEYCGGIKVMAQDILALIQAYRERGK